jgi:hypothetical protein
MRRRRRIITIGGVPRQLTPEHALRFEVVRGVLTGMLAIERGALKLGMPVRELRQLVGGARQAVIRELGRGALEDARRQAHAPF